MSETTGTVVKGGDVNSNAVRLINDEFWRQDVKPWCEPVDGAHRDRQLPGIVLPPSGQIILNPNQPTQFLSDDALRFGFRCLQAQLSRMVIAKLPFRAP